MSHGSPTTLLVILGLAVVGSTIVSALWPRIAGRGPKRCGSPSAASPSRYVTAPPDSGPPDPGKRWMTVRYVKPDKDDIEDDDFRHNLAGSNHMSLGRAPADQSPWAGGPSGDTTPRA